MKNVVCCLTLVLVGLFFGIAKASIVPQKTEELSSINGWNITRHTLAWRYVDCRAQNKKNNTEIIIIYGDFRRVADSLYVGIKFYNRKLPIGYKGPASLLLFDEVVAQGILHGSGSNKELEDTAYFGWAAFESVKKFETQFMNSKRLVLESEDEIIEPVLLEADYSIILKTLKACYEDSRVK